MKESGRDVPAATSAATITAIVVDDEPLGRQELTFLLRAHPDIQIVAEGRNGLEALQLIKEHEPEVVFLDVAMPGQDGIFRFFLGSGFSERFWEASDSDSPAVDHTSRGSLLEGHYAVRRDFVGQVVPIPTERGCRGYGGERQFQSPSEVKR